MISTEIICPKEIPNGEISDSCSRKYKSSCRDYQCNEGYVALSAGPFLTCNSWAQWEWLESKGPPCASKITVKLQKLSLAPCCRIYRVTDEA